MLVSLMGNRLFDGAKEPADKSDNKDKGQQKNGHHTAKQKECPQA